MVIIRQSRLSGGSRASDKGGGGGGGHPDPEISGGWSPKNFFAALRASVWSTNKCVCVCVGGGGGGGLGDPPLKLPDLVINL